MNDFYLKKGIKLEITKITENKDSAISYDSGLVDVFSTPAMIAFMESVSYKAVSNHIADGYSTVGFEVNIKHIKATPIGMNVKCVSELINIEGKKLTFKVEAFDEDGLIGEGTHTRYIINQEKFMNNLKKQ